MNSLQFIKMTLISTTGLGLSVFFLALVMTHVTEGAKAHGRSSFMGSRIVNGQNVTPINKYPMILRLEYPDAALVCGATILNKHCGLTAAHCLADETLGTIYAYAGLYHLNKSDPLCTQKVKLTNWTIHERYRYDSNGFLANDVAVFRVSPPFVYNDRVTPTNLPSCDWDVTKDLQGNVTAVGWGLGMGGNLNHPPLFPLQELDLPLRTTAACQRIYKHLTITEDQVCAGEVGNYTICYGDSGGPLFEYDEKTFTYIQVGMVSLGEALCDNNITNHRPGIFVKVPKFLNWIQRTIRECDKRRILNETMELD